MVDLIELAPVLVAVVKGAQLIFPKKITGVATIVVAAVAGALIYNLPADNSIVAGSLWGLRTAGIITVIREFASNIKK